MWRKEQSLRKTFERKPEIIEKLKREGKLAEEELKILEKIEREWNREQS
jgi:tRNA (guanine37-N1)-methyltransferase